MYEGPYANSGGGMLGSYGYGSYGYGGNYAVPGYPFGYGEYYLPLLIIKFIDLIKVLLPTSLKFKVIKSSSFVVIPRIYIVVIKINLNEVSF